MVKEKRRIGQGQAPGSHAKERHKRNARASGWSVVPSNLNARPEAPGLKSKHHSYFELVENTDKKKKLEFKITGDIRPPPGFDFVPIGNPELTTACKELSREQDALIFIVSTETRPEVSSLSHQVNRIGHHIRQKIVEQARASIGDSDDSSERHLSGRPEPIPDTQEEINEQADNAIRDLFPRIPNTDRQTIIEHSFRMGAMKKGEPLVGLAKDITLSRRVQLAVLAHIRHTHTRYDQLLKETSYGNARRAVEELCLDILVKWRGDEETGRDQLDEILREVIVISDSEGEEEADGDEDYTSETGGGDSDSSIEEIYRPAPQPFRSSPPVGFAHFVLRPAPVDAHRTEEAPGFESLGGPENASVAAYVSAPPQTSETLGMRRGRRGFRRYQAALSVRWDEARTRVRLQEERPAEHPGAYRYPDELDRPPREHLDMRFPSPSRQPGPSRPSGPSGPPGQLGPPYQEFPERRASGYGSAYRVSYPPASGNGHLYSVPEYERQPITPAGLPPAGMAYGANSSRPGQVAMVRSEEVRDYLVPSVEPMSPMVTDLTVPILVRTLSPRPGTAMARYGVQDTHHSLSWGESAQDFRAAGNSGAVIRLPPPFHEEHPQPPVYVVTHGDPKGPDVPFMRVHAPGDYQAAYQPSDRLPPPPAHGMRAHSLIQEDWPARAPQVGAYRERECGHVEARTVEVGREPYPRAGIDVVGSYPERYASPRRRPDGVDFHDGIRHPYSQPPAASVSHAAVSYPSQWAARNYPPGTRYAQDGRLEQYGSERADNGWPYRDTPEGGQRLQSSAYGHEHPPLPPDVRVIRSYPENPENPDQQYGLPPQGWPHRGGYR